MSFENYDKSSKTPLDVTELEQAKFIKTILDAIAVRTKAPDTETILAAILAALGGSTVNDSVIKHLAIPLAATEVPFSLEANIKQILIQNNSPNDADLQITFVVAESGTKYITIPSGNSYHLDKISFNSKTLYVQSNKASTLVEIQQIT